MSTTADGVVAAPRRSLVGGDTRYHDKSSFSTEARNNFQIKGRRYIFLKNVDHLTQEEKEALSRLEGAARALQWRDQVAGQARLHQLRACGRAGRAVPETAAGWTVSFGPIALGVVAHGGDRLRKRLVAERSG